MCDTLNIKDRTQIKAQLYTSGYKDSALGRYDTTELHIAIKMSEVKTGNAINVYSIDPYVNDILNLTGTKIEAEYIYGDRANISFEDYKKMLPIEFLKNTSNEDIESEYKNLKKPMLYDTIEKSNWRVARGVYQRKMQTIEDNRYTEKFGEVAQKLIDDTGISPENFRGSLPFYKITE